MVFNIKSLLPKQNKKTRNTVISQDVTEFGALVELGLDREFYLSTNADVAEAGFDPLQHFIDFGRHEGRDPSAVLSISHAVAENPDLEDIAVLASFMAKRGTEPAPEPVVEPTPEPVVEPAPEPVVEPAPAPVAKPAPAPVAKPAPAPGGGLSQADAKVMQPFFDEDYYLEQNPDVALSGVNPMLHYCTIGWIEGKDPSPLFSTRYYLNNNRDIRNARINPLLHYARNGHKEKWRKSATVEAAKVLLGFESGPLAEQLAHAKTLEPMIAIPVTPRTVTSPLIAAEKMTDAAESLRKAFGPRRYRHVIAIPHVRMSGAARVAAAFAAAMADIEDPSDVLLLLTDASHFEYAQWFPENVRQFDLSHHIADLGPEQKMQVFYDVLRGVGCERVININSRLAWDALALYGRQMSQEFHVTTYMFTWDENVQGDRVGYPIQWLRDTADFHDLILTDTKNLVQDICDRFGYKMNKQVVALYTPVSLNPDWLEAQENSVPTGRKRFLWAGRFDRQKRVDVLVGIAKACPDIDFHVYGKAVLDGKNLADFNPPGNITAMGTYDDFSEVLENGYSGFLYTAQWDGLPTILLDAAQAGLPLVAPDVGGIRELINDENGWLIAEYDDVQAYSAALHDVIYGGLDTRAKVENMHKTLARQFSKTQYINSIKKARKNNEL